LGKAYTYLRMRPVRIIIAFSTLAIVILNWYFGRFKYSGHTTAGELSVDSFEPKSPVHPETEPPLTRPLETKPKYPLDKCMEFVTKRDFSFGAPYKNWEEIYIRWSGMKPMFVKPGALIIEVGTNIGEDIEGFLKVCNDCYYETFEPVQDFITQVEAKWGNVSRLKVHKFGLAEKDKNLTLCVAGGATADVTRYSGDCRQVTLMVRDAVREVRVVMNKHHRVTPRSVEIFHLNCEGCEFDVLESIIAADMLQYFKNVQFSAHFLESNVEKAKESMARACKIRETLSRTHHCTYLCLTPNGNSNWENWRMDGEPDT